MVGRIVTILLLLGVVLSTTVLVRRLAVYNLPGSQQGYQPAQPIAYSHRLHAGELQIPCLYCHSGAETSRHAGIPAVSTCMNCHKFVTAPLGAVRAADALAEAEGRQREVVVSPELRKLYDVLALDDRLQPDPGRTPAPVAWTKVHTLPDFVYFDHRSHVSVGLECQRCHGPVETMERVRQVESLGMGWCVDCHRESNRIGVGQVEVRASLDCVTCHY